VKCKRGTLRGNLKRRYFVLTHSGTGKLELLYFRDNPPRGLPPGAIGLQPRFE